MGRYFIPASGLESYGRQLLEQSVRDGNNRRPLVVFLKKHWMVHDLVAWNSKALGPLESASTESLKLLLKERPSRAPLPAGTVVSGIWFSSDSPAKAIILWCWLVHHRYRARLENGTEILHFTSKFFGDLSD